MQTEIRRRIGLRSAAVVAVLLTSIALTGCDEDEEALQQTSGGSASDAAGAQDADADTQDPAVPPEDSETAEEPEDAPSSALTGADCLVGTWTLDNDSFRALLESAGGAAVKVSGSVIIVYETDGSTSTTYDDWTTVSAQDGSTVTMQRTGQDTGTYEASDDGVFRMDTLDAASTIELVITSPDQSEYRMRPENEDPPVSSGNYTCEGDSLSVADDEGNFTTLLRN